MSNNPASDIPRKYLQLPQHGKTLLAALIGAALGSAACLHTYYTSLGGAEQYKRAAQIEATVEHNRKVVEQTLAVGEQTLALLMRIEAGNTERAALGGNTLSKRPTPREIDDAIEGLFEGLNDSAGLTNQDPAATTPAPTQDGVQAEAPATDGSDAKNVEKAHAASVEGA